jgi:Fur family ferric uptake transcriptional regulator
MTAIELLKKNNIRVSKIREEILEALIKSKSSLSCSDILKLVTITKDRTTVYLTLKLFIKKGFVNYAFSSEAKLRFIFNSENDKNINVLFKCISCNKSFYFSNQKIPIQLIRENFDIRKVLYYVTGICSDCN